MRWAWRLWAVRCGAVRRGAVWWRDVARVWAGVF